MSFLYPFLNFLQPGILWPAIADVRPMLVASALALFIGLGSRSDYPRAAAFHGKVFLYLVVFIVAQVASVYYSGVSGMLEELGFWYVFPLFIVISVLLMTNPTAMKRYVWGMMVGSMVVVLYGIYAVPAWGGYQHTGRAGAYGMYDNHNDYSFIIIQIVPFLYMYRKIEGSMLRRLLLLLSLAACALGIAMSLSRGGMIALVVEAVFIVLIGMEGKKRFWLLPVIAVIGVAAIGYQYAKRAENQTNYTAEDAESGRFELWKAGVIMLEKNPLLGVGSRRFPEYAHKYYELSHDMQGKVSHNTYVEIFSGSGLIGFFGFVLAGRHLVRNLRRRAAPNCPPIIEATRKATLISLYAIILRAFLDAKPHDWCFYTLCAIGIACHLLQQKYESSVEGSNAQGSNAPPDKAKPSWGNLQPMASSS